MKTLITTILSGMLFLGTSMCANAQNLLINGSFEEPVVDPSGLMILSPCSTDIPGWKVGCYPTTFVLIYSSYLRAPSDGLNSLELQISSAISQDFVVTAG